MAEYTAIQNNCPACRGSGIQTFNTESPYDEACGRCAGVGYLPWGRLDISSIMNDLNTLKTQVQVLYDDLNP